MRLVGRTFYLLLWERRVYIDGELTLFQRERPFPLGELPRVKHYISRLSKDGQNSNFNIVKVSL